MMKRIRYFVTLLLMPMVAACASLNSLEQSVKSLFVPLVLSRYDEATVLISVNTVVPWDQIADAVQPNFSLTGDQALLQVAPTTERIQEQILRAFGVSLGIGLSPANTTSKISTPQAPTGVPAGGQLPAAPSVSGDIGLDPILKYQAASTLYQAVQLLNREVQYATVGDEFVPYLVTMKLAVIPYKPNVSDDIHVRISLFPGEGVPNTLVAPTSAPSQQNYSSSPGLPRVVPILVTDDIERALKSSAVEAVRQIGLALSAAVQGVGGSLAANNTNQTLNAVSGQDINSRLTVTRLLDNTIYVKIGASYEPTAGVALVGQTYNVSLLILVPRTYFVEKDRGPKIKIFVNSELRNALKGSILAKRPTNILVSQTDEAVQETLEERGYGGLLTAWNRLPSKMKEYIARLLITPIQTSNFADFEDTLKGIPLRNMNEEEKKKIREEKEEKKKKKNISSSDPKAEDQKISLDALDEDDKRALWTRLSIILVDSSLKIADFELPLPPLISIPPQTGLLLDDTKDKAQVQLKTTSGASTRTLAATLTLNLKLNQSASPNDYELVAQTITLDQSTGVLTLTFPSPAKWGFKESNINDSSLAIGSRCLKPNPRCPELEVPTSPIKLLYSAVKAADAAPGLDFTAVTTEIRVTKGVGSAEVSVAKLNDDYALITVKGVQVDKATDGSGAPVTITNGQVKVVKDTKDTKDKKVVSIIFQLKGLIAGKTFTIQAEGYKASKTTGTTDDTKTGTKQISFTAIGR